MRKSRKPTHGQPVDVLSFGDVCQGWTRKGWIDELRRKADRCESMHPITADTYRRWAGHLSDTNNPKQ